MTGAGAVRRRQRRERMASQGYPRVKAEGAQGSGLVALGLTLVIRHPGGCTMGPVIPPRRLVEAANRAGLADLGGGVAMAPPCAPDVALAVVHGEMAEGGVAPTASGSPVPNAHGPLQALPRTAVDVILARKEANLTRCSRVAIQHKVHAMLHLLTSVAAMLWGRASAGAVAAPRLYPTSPRNRPTFHYAARHSVRAVILILGLLPCAPLAHQAHAAQTRSAATTTQPAVRPCSVRRDRDLAVRTGTCSGPPREP